MSITAKELAKKFRESVDFDFARESIVSYDQILTMGEGTDFYSVSGGDNFYSLTDKEAFNALLNDYITDDNQLVDIFLDLYDAKLGLQRIADPRVRNNPKQIIIAFINMEKYKYHQTHIAKVYQAINTWLLFVGATEVSMTWNRCPVCGGVVKNDACVTCKKSNSDFHTMLNELNIMLQNEKKGKPTATPKYWNDIKPNTEFYNDYKSGIESYRSDRDNKDRAAKEQEKKQKIVAAEKEINSLKTLLNIEEGKENPAFDAILVKIGKNVEINEAIKYNDPELNKKLTALKNDIVKKKQEDQIKKERLKHTDEFIASMNKFLQYSGILKLEMSTRTMPLVQLKIYFEEANQLYAKLAADLSSGFIAPSREAEDAVKKYQTEVRTPIGDYIMSAERDDKLKSQRASLQADIHVIENLFNGIGAKDNRSALITKRFNAEIEHNKAYSEFQTNCRQEYYQMVAPIRDRLNKLILEENNYKVTLFRAEAEALKAAVANANPRQGKAKELADRWTAVLNKDIYSSIQGNGDVKLISDAVKEKVRVLYSAEVSYLKEVERVKLERERKKQGVYFFLFLCVFALISAVILFVPALVQSLALGRTDIIARFLQIVDPLMIAFPIFVVLLDVFTYLIVKREKYRKSRTVTLICGLIPQIIFTVVYIVFYFISPMLF